MQPVTTDSTKLYDIFSSKWRETEVRINYPDQNTKRIEYILEWNLENPSVWIMSVPFSLKGSSKCTNHVNVHKLSAVEYINTVCSLDFPFQFRIF